MEEMFLAQQKFYTENQATELALQYVGQPPINNHFQEKLFL
jgi:hypothetical protein